jgi:MFS transporter, DHA3 family, macrolide efflux protein
MRSFLVIWGGQVVSMVGTAMTRFALLVWAWEETGRATSLSLLLFCQIGATVVASPIAGALVDRWDRKRVMMLSDLGAAAATAALLALLLAGRLEIGALYAAALLAGAFEAFQFPAYSAAVTLMLPGRHYARASGLVSLAQSGSLVLGPPLAGVLLPFVGIAWVLAIDLATVAVAIGCLAAVEVPRRAAPVGAAGAGGAADDDGADAPGFGAQMAYGFRYIARRRGLLGLQALLAAGNFLLIFGVVLRAPLVLARTGGDELALGQVMAAAGLGGVLGGLALALWGGPRRRIRGVLAGWVLSALGNVLLGFGRTLAWWCAGAFLYPFWLTLTNGLNQAIWQSKVAPAVQGRVFAARRLIAQASLLPGMLLAGPLVDLVLAPRLGPAHPLAPWLGTGTAAAAGLAVGATALLALAATSAGSASRAIRGVEEDLPDHAPARAA